MPNDQLKMSKDKLDIKSGQLVDRSKLKKLEYAGTDTVNNAKCYKLQITDADNNVSTAYIDAVTYYMVRSETKVKMPGQDGEQEVAVNYSNFKKQKEGVVFPMIVGSPQGDVTFKSVEFNPKVSETIFKPGEPAVKGTGK